METSGSNESGATKSLSLGSAWVLLLLGIMGLLFLRIQRKNSKLANLPPGPRNWPVLGALFEMDLRMHRGFHRLAQKFGPVVFLKLGIQSVVIVSTGASAKEVLKSKDEFFADRANAMTSTASKYCGFDGELFPFAKNDAQLKLIRKVLFTEFFTMGKLRMYEKLRRREVAVMVDKIFVSLEDGEKTEGALLVPVREIAKGVPLNVLFELVFGKRYDTLEESDHLTKFTPVMDEFLRLFMSFPLTDLFPFLRWLDPQGLQKEFVKFRKVQNDFYEGILEERRRFRVSQKLSRTSADGAPENSMNFVDVLLNLQEDGGEINDRGIMSALLGTLIAGVDTTASTVEWAVLELVRSPTNMKRLQEELDAVVGRNRMVEESDVENLPFLNAFVAESMRLHPVVTFTPMHVNETGSTLGGYEIPPKTAVVINIYSIGRDPEFWKNPEEFNPDRFLQNGYAGDPNLIVGPTRVFGSDYNLLPFSSGRRSCVGFSLAMVMILRMVAVFAHAFDWSPRPGLKPEDMSVDEDGSFVIHPVEDLCATPTPRLPRHVYGSCLK